MIVAGEWYPYPDGITRPVVYGSAARPDGTPIAVRFLVDCGADQTVFTAPEAQKLLAGASAATAHIAGIGGVTDSVKVDTIIEFNGRDGGSIRLRGGFAGFLDSHESELAILGRDVLDQFHVILSRRRDEVLLLFANHDYQVFAR